MNVCGALVSTPPLAVPPLSCSCTVTSVLPLALGAGVNVSVPVAEIAGATVNSAGLAGVTRKLSVCAASSAGPALIAVAQPVTDCAPALSSTV